MVGSLEMFKKHVAYSFNSPGLNAFANHSELLLGALICNT
jgi:hypothetical protein